MEERKVFTQRLKTCEVLADAKSKELGRLKSQTARLNEFVDRIRGFADSEGLAELKSCIESLG